MNIEIANRLQKLRKEKGYSQEQLAEELGISRQAVSKWERAESSPDTDNLICLAKLYNVSLDCLLSTDDTIEEIKETQIVDKTEQEAKLLKIDVESKQTEEDLEDNDDHPIDSVIIFVIIIAYLLLGSLGNLWHPGWIIFVFYPVILSIFECVRERKVSSFLYPVFIAGIYLILGFLFGWWHPGWVLFITIPLFYIVASAIDKE